MTTPNDEPKQGHDETKTLVLTGWKCPNCGAGNSPWTTRCACVPYNVPPMVPYPFPPWPSYPPNYVPWYTPWTSPWSTGVTQ